MKVRNIIFIILASIILLLPLVKLDKVGGGISESEQRQLAAYPTSDFFTPEYKEELRQYLNDNIGYREKLMKIRTVAMMSGFNMIPNPVVKKGDNGYYFYNEGYNLEIATGEFPLTDARVNTVVDSMTKVKNKLDSKGIDFAVFLPPSKVSIYPEYTKLGVDSIDKTPSEIIAEALNEKTNVPTISLRQTMMEAKEKGDYYFKTDSHWNYEGAYIGYSKCIDFLNSNGYSLKKAGVSYYEYEFASDLSALIGVKASLGTETVMCTQITDAKAIDDQVSDRYIELTSILDEYGFNGVCSHFVNPECDGPKVIMFGDSLFGYWNMPYLFAESFSEFTYIWNYDMYEAVIDYLNPDLVIYEMGERFTNTLPDKNFKFIKRYLSDYNACVTDVKEDKENFYITVMNTSNDIWERTNEVNLALFVNEMDGGVRGYLDYGDIVKPGESYTFELPKEWLSEIEEYKDDIYIGMVHEGAAYFGERRKLYE